MLHAPGCPSTVFGTVDPRTPEIGLFAGGADLHVYRDGGWRVLHDLPLYSGPVVLGCLHTYSPFSAIAFVPLERIPGAYVDNIWMVVNLGVLAGCILLCWRILGYRITPHLVPVTFLMTLTCTFLEPLRTTLFYGQINLVLRRRRTVPVSTAVADRVRAAEHLRARVRPGPRRGDADGHPARADFCEASRSHRRAQRHRQDDLR
ncbi:glycosyltransferase 87 family protein [Rhodococcus sp. NPDC056960]|uniref:glycosyltransferase 87 family protein n=1 Tax=Rhodococcus sp. NPDC056960 TaxID=3345982 RepID=UPI003625780E